MQAKKRWMIISSGLLTTGEINYEGCIIFVLGFIRAIEEQLSEVCCIIYLPFVSAAI